MASSFSRKHRSHWHRTFTNNTITAAAVAASATASSSTCGSAAPSSPPPKPHPSNQENGIYRVAAYAPPAISTSTRLTQRSKTSQLPRRSRCALSSIRTMPTARCRASLRQISRARGRRIRNVRSAETSLTMVSRCRHRINLWQRQVQRFSLTTMYRRRNPADHIGQRPDRRIQNHSNLPQTNNQ